MADNKSTIIAAVIGAVTTVITSVVSGLFSYNSGFDKGLVQGTEQVVAVSAPASTSSQQASSIDEDAIYNNGFNDGYEEGIEKGKIEAVSSLDVDAIQKEGYNKGYQEGLKKGQAESIVHNGLNAPSTSDNDENNISLLSLNYSSAYSGGNLGIIDQLEDNFGNVHHDVIVGSEASNEIFLSLDGTYTSLSGTIFRSDAFRGTPNDMSPKITITYDGNVLERVIHINSKPVSFTIDLKGVKNLEIFIEHAYYKSGNYTGGVSNFYLHK